MRFILSIWLLILSSLTVFTFVALSHQFLAPGVPPIIVRVSMLLAAWTVGLSSAAAIHVLYRRAEQVTQRAARDETLVQLAGAVAHELNQPLTVVISSAELMARRDRSPDEMRAVAARMAEASERMADIVSKLQAATCYRSKPYVGRLSIVDLDRAS